MIIKKTLLLTAVVILLGNCDERSENSVTNKHSLFNKSVGERISTTVAAQWAERKRNSAGRCESFSVTATKLLELLNRTENKIGLFLHHAEDPGGEPHLFIATVKDDLKSWTNGSVLDATTNEFVNENTAKTWVQAYKSNYPDGPWSHFFGIDVIDEITSIEGFERMDLVAGEDEAGTSPLLLYVFSGNSINGRGKGEVDVFDRGAICPPTCFDE